MSMSMPENHHTNQRFRELEQLVDKRMPKVIDRLLREGHMVHVLADTFAENDEDLKAVGALTAVAARYGARVVLYVEWPITRVTRTDRDEEATQGKTQRS